MTAPAGIERDVLYSLKGFSEVIGLTQAEVMDLFIKPRKVAFVKAGGTYHILGQWWHDFVLPQKIEPRQLDAETPAEPDETDWLTMKELTKVVKMSETTIRKLMNEEGFPFNRPGARNLRFSRAAVNEWMRRNR